MAAERRNNSTACELKRALYKQSSFVPLSGSKRIYPQNLSIENDFDLHENKPVDGTHFHMNEKNESLKCNLIFSIL